MLTVDYEEHISAERNNSEYVRGVLQIVLVATQSLTVEFVRTPWGRIVINDLLELDNFLNNLNSSLGEEPEFTYVRDENGIQVIHNDQY